MFKFKDTGQRGCCFWAHVVGCVDFDMGGVWDYIIEFSARCEVRIWPCLALSSGEMRLGFVFGMRSEVNCVVPTVRLVKTCVNENRWKLGKDRCRNRFFADTNRCKLN